MTKAEIRALSARFGLPTADKPQMACLSSRVPYGEAVTVEKLRMIEAAEEVLRGLGFRLVRVRHHEMRTAECGAGSASSEPPCRPILHSAVRTPQSAPRYLACIEVGLGEMPRFLGGGVCGQVADALQKIGYVQVTLDLHGYRRGSLNWT